MTNSKIQRASAAVIVRGNDLFVETSHLAVLFGRPHRNIMRDVNRLVENGAINALKSERIFYRDSMGRHQEALRLCERDALVLMPFIGGKKSMDGQARLVDEFLAVRKKLRSIDSIRADSEWTKARLHGKAEHHEMTGAVQLLALRAFDRGDSTTPLNVWITTTTKSVIRTLFDLNGEPVKAIRERLTTRQLRHLATAEEIYANKIFSLLDTNTHHKVINAEAKGAVDVFVKSIGGRQVPGIYGANMRLAA